MSLLVGIVLLLSFFINHGRFTFKLHHILIHIGQHEAGKPLSYGSLTFSSPSEALKAFYTFKSRPGIWLKHENSERVVIAALVNEAEDGGDEKEEDELTNLSSILYLRKYKGDNRMVWQAIREAGLFLQTQSVRIGMHLLRYLPFPY